MESLSIVMVAPPYFDLPPAGYGGIEAVVADLTDGLMAAGHKVTLVGAGRNGTMGELVSVWPSTLGDRLGDPAVEVEIALMTRRAVEKLIARRAVDIVHDHTFSAPVNAAFYSGLGVPTLTTVHGPAHEQNRRIYRALGADAGLISISHQQRRLAPELNWVDTVYNGLRPGDWPYSEAKQDYALFLGRYHPDKGTHLAIEAAHRAGLRLILAGKRMEAVEKEYFEQVIEPMLGPDDIAMGVADATQKRELLVNARCLLFPITWQEPFGMVMIESMVCGTPVVALRSGSVPEVVEHGVTGLVCDDPDELPQALADVALIDPAACRRRVSEQFSAKAMARGYARVYQQAVESAGRLARI